MFGPRPVVQYGFGGINVIMMKTSFILLRPWLDVEMRVRCHDIASSKVATLKNNAATENIMRYPHKGVG